MINTVTNTVVPVSEYSKMEKRILGDSNITSHFFEFQLKSVYYFNELKLTLGEPNVLIEPSE